MHKTPNKKILIVGAGLSGVTIARQLADSGFEVTVIDKKNHVGGHCFDYFDDSGIRVHKYGPHIFHTSNELVVKWLSQFTDWIDYEHRVVAKINSGDLVIFPPNLSTLKKISKDNLVDTFYRPYSEKMWGIKLEELNPKIINRVPIREDYEDRYFPKETFQKLPKNGYTSLVENILDHKKIKIKLNFAFDKKLAGDFYHVFNSMPIDEYFNYKFGQLPYRSIKFHHELHNISQLSKHPVVNYTDNSVYTRHTEWKHFPNHGDSKNQTLVTREEPCDYRENNFERYYPVIDMDGENRKLYQKYKTNIPDNMTFIGRCGMYVYINMDQAISSSLSLSKKFILKEATL